jgi:hypothetical protein
MDQSIITLIVGLVGIIATLISSLFKFYFTSKARTNDIDSCYILSNSKY